MTREEAIEIIELEKLRYKIHLNGSEKADNDEYYEVMNGFVEAYDMAIKALEHRWIPVSERLPKNDEDVLVCSSQGAMEVCYYHIDATFYPTEYADLNETGWYNEDDDVLGFEPIAWMPLPEPYKAESEEV